MMLPNSLKKIYQLTSKEYVCKGVTIEQFKESLCGHLDSNKQSFLSSLKEPNCEFEINFSKSNQFYISRTKEVFNFDSNISDKMEMETEGVFGEIKESRNGITVELSSRFSLAPTLTILFIFISIMAFAFFSNQILVIPFFVLGFLIMIITARHSKLLSFYKFDRRFSQWINRTFQTLKV